MIYLAHHNLLKSLLIIFILSLISAIWDTFFVNMNGGSWSLLGASLSITISTVSYIPMAILIEYLKL